MRKSYSKKVNEALKIFGCIAVCLLAGIIGALFTATGPNSWYTNLVKPSFNPPNWIFGPVWTTLYILMGIALYLAVKHKAGIKAIIVFAAQLLLNTFWTIIFFGFEKTGLALIEIVVLWAFILWTIMLFYKKSKAAAYLLIPYILWVTFAALLTLAIYILN
jgi:tryptophan-rich sensory protein